MLALTLLFAAGGVLLILLSIPMMRGRVTRNSWYGVRLPPTLNDERLWDAANRFGGKCLFVVGAIWTAAALLLSQRPGLTPDDYALLMTGVLGLTLLPAIGLILWFVYGRKR
jgi:uncharacterized membrane protein